MYASERMLAGLDGWTQSPDLDTTALLLKCNVERTHSGFESRVLAHIHSKFLYYHRLCCTKLGAGLFDKRKVCTLACESVNELLSFTTPLANALCRRTDATDSPLSSSSSV